MCVASAVTLAKGRIESTGLAIGSEIKGCALAAVDAIELNSGCRLPRVYKAFLHELGGGAGKFLSGSDWTCPKLTRIQREARGLLRGLKAENPLPASAFVFLMHQGYQFRFFRCDGDDDPAVYLFAEGENAPRQVFARFSDWLMQCVDDEAANWEVGGS